MSIKDIILGKEAEAKPATETKPNQQVVSTPPATDDAPKEEPKGRTVKYNKEDRFVPDEEVNALVQKGLHHDVVQEKLTKAQETLLRAAKLNGFETPEAYLEDLSTKEKAQIQQTIEDAYGDPDKMDQAIRQHPLVKQAAELAAQAVREKAKSTLKGQPFYRELESELDKVLDANPGVDADVAYDFLIGKLVREGKMDELISKAKSDAVKKTTADIQDQSRRGSHSGSAGSQDPGTLSDTGRAISKIFGVDPGRVAQRIARK